MLTYVDGGMRHFGPPKALLIRRTTPDLFSAQLFQAGTMAPKVAAAVAIARAGKMAMIGGLGDLQALLEGTKGTWVLPDGSPL